MFNTNSKMKAMLTAAMLATVPAVPALAHHSFAMYDNAKDVTFDGTVRSFRWANPHGQIILTTMRDGKPIDYAIELSSLNVMSRAGWTRKSIVIGERMKATVHPLRDGSDGGSFVSAVKADGSVLRSAAPR
ncbi:DUF6152 family protein [Sphingomonas sp.]|uniref:DUF6152 family protein n=1 Tax=Sphingomonas sp. TaxID=28214 RepID=UPI0035BBEEFD